MVQTCLPELVQVEPEPPVGVITDPYAELLMRDTFVLVHTVSDGAMYILARGLPDTYMGTTDGLVVPHGFSMVK